MMLFFSILWLSLLLYIAMNGEEAGNKVWLGGLIFINVASLILLFF